MLERAKACLKSGAQQSLRCANATKPTRSTRTLHSTFWSHGAGHLDLPPWAVGPPISSDLLLKHDSRSSGKGRGGNGGGKRRETAGTWASPSDGVFLDFLYPPQALALMKPANGQQWEMRNAKRLPEGFIQASRGYASRSYGQTVGGRGEDVEENGATEGKEHHDTHASESQDSTSTEAALDKVEGREEQDREQPESKNSLASEPIELDDSVEGFDEAGAVDSDDAGLEALRAASAAQDEDWTGSDFGDSPAELAEAGVDAMQRLKTTLSVRSKSPAAVGRVLRTYDALDAAGKDDLRLKLELLDWLSHHHTSEADVRCAEIYRSLTTEQRTLPVYQAALSIFLRRGLHVQAVKLHKEALNNIANGAQITKAFFQYAVDHNRWQLAMNVEAQFRLVTGSHTKAKQHLFWLHVSEMPNLMLKALKLANHLRILNRASTVNEQTRHFIARFFSEALIQEFRTADLTKSEPTFPVQGVPQRSVGRMFDELRHLGEDAPRIIQDVLSAMLSQRHPSYQYTNIHRLVSYIYLAYRDTGAVMPEGLLMALLEPLTRFWGQLRRQKELHHSLTVKTLITDWERSHGKLSRDAVKCLLSWYASQGRVDRFEQWMKYYKEQYPGDDNQMEVLHSAIYLHARRGDLAASKKAFDEALAFANALDDTVPLRCWNVLIHAYSRADDLEGGLDALHNLVNADLVPDEFSFHPIMEMMAKRGDVDGVKDLLSQYDDLANKKREAAFFGSLITAHANCDEIEQAEAVLRKALDEVRTGKVRGSLTGSFNNILAAYALRRNVDATMRVYRWMQDEHIRLDADTFAALIQALTVYRQINAAYKILQKVMKEHNVRPTAFHYALVMTGYIKQGMHVEAVEVHKRMRDDNVRPSFSSNAAYLRAKGLLEQRGLRQKGQPETAKLSETIAALKSILQSSRGEDIALKQPQPSMDLVSSSGPAGVTAKYFSFLILLHGRRKCFNAVQRLYRESKTEAEKRDGTEQALQEPLQFLTALMVAYLRAGEWKEMERCWKLCKEQADDLAKRVPVPLLKPAPADDEPVPDVLELQPPALSDAQEVGFNISNDDGGAERGRSARSPPPTEVKQAMVTVGPQTPAAPKPTPGRRYILSRPLRYYLYALAAQSRAADLLSTVARLFGQGYTLDNRTWNVFIRLLCQNSPPLVLLAFTLTERFLIPHFPGWASVSKTYSPNKSARAEGLEYIRARYLRPGQLMPQYRTLVVLGAALLKLRRVDALGRSGAWNKESMKGLERYVGTAREVRQQAARTVFVVQSMPMVEDALQNRLLRRQ